MIGMLRFDSYDDSVPSRCDCFSNTTLLSTTALEFMI